MQNVTAATRHYFHCNILITLIITIIVIIIIIIIIISIIIVKLCAHTRSLESTCFCMSVCAYVSERERERGGGGSNELFPGVLISKCHTAKYITEINTTLCV